MPPMSNAEIAERFIAAFSAADFDGMRGLLAPDLVSWVTGADGEMMRLVGAEDYLGRVEAMDLPAARFSVELTQAAVPVGADRVMLMVEVHAERGGRTLHNFAGHLLRIEGEQIAEWWMVDAKPAESDTFWSS
jgi:ketosteroid isomerase-like protein